MQIFTPYTEPIKVARCLDARRLNKQIIECGQIIAAIDGTGKGWFNHPIVHMYRDHVRWVKYYMKTLKSYRYGDIPSAMRWSSEADAVRPPFLTQPLCDQHKRRLFTKDPQYYERFSYLGPTDENWYVVGGEIVKYKKGKKVLVK